MRWYLVHFQLSNTIARIVCHLTQYFHKEPLHLSQASGSNLTVSPSCCNLLIKTLIIIHFSISQPGPNSMPGTHSMNNLVASTPEKPRLFCSHHCIACCEEPVNWLVKLFKSPLQKNVGKIKRLVIPASTNSYYLSKKRIDAGNT